MQEFCCFIVFLCQYIHSFIFPEMAGGRGYSPLSHPPKSATDYGVEKHLYNLQKQILDMSGPLTCLWADLLNRDAMVNPKDVILLLQSTLTLLGSASYTITQERRRMAWSRVNPSIGALPEDTEVNQEKLKETTLFGGGFLERATKRIEQQKALAKVAGASNGLPRPHKHQLNRDPHDLRHFLEKGAPAKYGGRNIKCQQPYPPKHQRRDQGRGNFINKKLPNLCTHNQFTNFNKRFFPYFWYVIPSNSWPSSPLPAQLASDNIQPMGYTSSERVQIRLDVNTTSEDPTTTSGSQGPGPPLNGGGDTEARSQGCRKEVHLLSGSIPQPDFSEGWIGEVGDQPETPKPVHPPNPFQDGEPGNNSRPAERGRLDGLNRLKGCLPISHNMGGPQKVSEISMERQSVRVPIPFVWPEQCTTCIHQIIEARPCKVSSSGNETDNVFGRYVGDGAEQGETREPSSSDNIPSRAVGFCSQQGEIATDPYPGNPLPFIVDSKEMKIRLLEEKVAQISMACRKIRKRGCASVRELARLIGKMTATLPAVFPAPLWYRELQRLKNQTYQRSQSFECMVTLSQEALLELDWWSVERNLMNEKSVITQDPDLTIETDTSMLGWGAVCQGIRTGGLWSQAERRNHINYLEFLAAWFGVRAFARDKRNIHTI